MANRLQGIPWVFAVLCFLSFDLVTGTNDGFLIGEKFRLLMTFGAMMAGGMVAEIDAAPPINGQHWGGSRNRRRNAIHSIFQKKAAHSTGTHCHKQTQQKHHQHQQHALEGRCRGVQARSHCHRSVGGLRERGG